MDDDYYCELPLDWEFPKWNEAQKVHDWKNYIFLPLQTKWNTFTSEQKQLIARNAEYQASDENWN